MSNETKNELQEDWEELTGMQMVGFDRTKKELVKAFDFEKESY